MAPISAPALAIQSGSVATTRLAWHDGRLPALLLIGETDGLVKMDWLARYEGIFPRHCSVAIAAATISHQEYDAACVPAELRAWWDEDTAA
jgi:hypothetical protein